MTEIADTPIPSAELQSDHRVDKNCSAMSVLCVDFIADIEGEEGGEVLEAAGKFGAAEDGDEWAVVEVPFFCYAESESESDVGMDFGGETSLDVEGGEVVSGLEGLKFEEGGYGGC